MISKTIRITNKRGIGARAAAAFAQTASKFESTPWFEKDKAKINAKSIMGIMSLALTEGDEIVLKVEGSDEEAAAEVLGEMLGSNFDE